MPEISKKTLRNLFLVVAGSIILYWLLHDTERVSSVIGVITGVIAPFFAGAGIAFVLNVPMRAFEGLLKNVKNGGWRRVLAFLLTVLAVCLVIALVFLLLIPQVTNTIETLIPQLTTFIGRMEDKVYAFLGDNPEVMEWVIDYTDFENMNWEQMAEKAFSVLGNSVATIIDGAFAAIGSVFSGIVNAVISVVFAIYCLFQKENLARQGRKLLYAFFPERFADHAVRILRLSNSTFSNFLSGQCVEVCILGAMFAISMAIFKMPYIPLVSVLVAVTAFIPIVGAWIGCIVGALLILVVDPMLAIWFVGMFLILQQIENNLIYPKVVGTSIGLSGMWVLVAVSVGGAIMGVAGMFLMIPFSSVLYAVLQELTHKRLVKKNVPEEKLQIQPPVLRSHFKEKRENKKKQWKTKKSEKEKKEKQ